MIVSFYFCVKGTQIWLSVSRPSVERKINSAFVFSFNLSFFISLFYLGWLNDFLAAAQGWWNNTAREARRRKFEVFRPPGTAKSSINQAIWCGLVTYLFSFFYFWLVGWTLSWPRPRFVFFVQPQLFYFPFLFRLVGWTNFWPGPGRQTDNQICVPLGWLWKVLLRILENLPTSCNRNESGGAPIFPYLS